ncbi:hypothetical protein GLOTRDRAFT_111444 [Gloeophyllum trabeum ATCC 11539]|uniref:histidine kinase n=1 Tax=Gloeophyllum trabeum (strain ATCC 11539 / FP-39264 / Madison 617) TaxID=670483 RepID=S7Q4C9_GLOTA|nr:uncharacterized protein GLOTRDRAFT_111444 [Gloeophyllum trabeum ATCC 11539]EPQ54871.1 hypothetical protein GLOTRDRAFT_111444 [Gloeophyllum trabeum ATCC 11539]
MPVLQSAMSSSARRRHKKARIEGGLRVHWDRFRKRMGTGTAPSTSEIPDESGTDSSARPGARFANAEELDEVDEVVVDREWAGRDLKTSITQSDGQENSREKSGGGGGAQGTNTDMDSIIWYSDGFWAICTPLIILRWRLWPAVKNFFWVHFDDPKSENHYRKELWFTRKSLALWSAVFFVATWVIGTAFIPKPIVLMDKIFYYAIVPALTAPLVFFVMYDFPRDRPVFYQFWLLCATWMWAIYQVLFMYMCGFYREDPDWLFTCGQKDFVGTFYYASGLPTIALFGLKQDRLPALIGAIIFFVISNALIEPLHRSWERNLLNFIVFYGFLLYVHFMRENAERRLYTLRDQLKIQFRATQKAQVNESKAADSKRRLTSYVFHEVRVPLNTALLAVQNMEAAGVVAKDQEVEFRALEASLTMMSKVLNDVLDFNRLDSGRFESVSKPYAFHQVMRSLLNPIKLATNARKLELVSDFDKSIDEIAMRALNEAIGEKQVDPMTQLLLEQAEGDGIVVGDEMRLRQIITNLVSNACKFTPEGGTVSITTKLVLPGNSLSLYRAATPTSNLHHGARSNEQWIKSEMLGDDATQHVLSAQHLSQHEQNVPKEPIDWIVVRIEVQDTGFGIPPKEMVESKLFSAFNQTEQGRQQGGKGTGLGLALVRQIVKRSGGRLGVKSKVNEGSTFWVELPLGIGRKALPELTPTTSLRGSQHKVRHFGTSPGSDKSTPPIDIESDPVISPTRRAMAAIQNITEPGNLAALILASHVEKADTSVGSSEESLDDLDPPSAHAPPTPDSPLYQRELKLEKEKEAESSPPVRPGPMPLTESKPSSEKEGDSGATVGVPSEKTIKPASPKSEREKITPDLPVLVVDDDPLTRSLMKRMLTRLGCNVSTAENGEMALKMINGGRPLSLVPTPMPTPSSENTAASYGLAGDARATPEEPHSRYAIVFLDNQMPVLSGVDAVRRLRQCGRRDLVVGVTGNALLSDQQEYLEAGVDHVLTKPVREASLKTMLVLADERRKRTLSPTDVPEESP